VDWVLALRQEEIERAEELPTLGIATDAIELLSSVAERWLSSDALPSLARIAFGAILLHPEPDVRAAYSRLPDYIPIQVDPEWRDFMFQTNLPVPSTTGIDGLRVNRLGRWSVGAFQTAVFSLPAGRALSALSKFALRLELDINTGPELSGAIPPARLIDVYRELVGSALAVASDGVGAP
jgi:hypothetical protein